MMSEAWGDCQDNAESGLTQVIGLRDQAREYRCCLGTEPDEG
jgi:hypothetical protein